MRKVIYGLWALGLLVAAGFVAQGIVRTLGKPVGYGYSTGQLLTYDEEIQAHGESNDGPTALVWDYERKGEKRVFVRRHGADGTIDLMTAWKRERPTVSKYFLNRQDAADRFGRMMGAQVGVESVSFRHDVVRETGDPVEPRSSGDLDEAFIACFERTTLLPGGHIGVGDHGNWEERFGPLRVRYDWEVKGREARAGQSCLVYEVMPSAVLAVKPETLPTYERHVWHSLGGDEGYVTTKGSRTTMWLSESGRIPLSVEEDRKWTIVPMKWYFVYYRTTTKLTLAQESRLAGEESQTAMKDSDAVLAAEGLAAEKRLPEAIDAYRPLAEESRKDSVWHALALARSGVLSNQLPLVGRQAPTLPAGDWSGETAPKSLEDLRGRVVLVDFWRLSVPPCLEAMKTLKALHAKYSDQGLYVVGVTQEEPQNEAAAIEKYIHQALIDYPTVIASDGLTDPAWQVRDFPYSVLIDRNGVVRWTGSAADAAGIEQNIQGLLAEK